MLTSRKALMSNLNYVHLQHVSLGVHLSMHPELNNSTSHQDTGVKDGCHHKSSDTTMVDPNSNDPSMPCQCCDQHPGQEASLQYSSLEDLDTIICEECLSPDDLPLSPLSLSSPSTDSSSSSDFTLDDSPASMYYKEYCQDGLDTPDQQPDIIPLDAAPEGHFSLETLGCNPSENNNPEITNNNNLEDEDPPFIDWGSDSLVDSNSNTLIEKSGSSIDSDTLAEPEIQTNQTGQAESTCEDYEPLQQDLLPGLPFLENTPKKTITSFHELALKRRKSGGQLSTQPKKDRSDWLIVFSPDTEQPPMNELTASVFYHGSVEQQSHPLPAGKEVTTFRELRYRNAQNKQSAQQMKAHEERPSVNSTEATTNLTHIGEFLNASWEPNDSPQHLTTKSEWLDATVEEGTCLIQGPQLSKSPACRNGSDVNIPPGRDHIQSGLMNAIPTIRNTCSRPEESSTAEVTWLRGMADGGDRRAHEAARTFSVPNVLLQASNVRSFYLYSPMTPRSSGPQYPRPSGQAQLPWYPGFPPRLSPVGASSPPHRQLLPMLDAPDVAILLSPMFPRKRTIDRLTRGLEAGCQTLTDPQDTAAECELLMADDAEDPAQRQKKGLLISVGSAVEKIISHFNTSRNQVQKAQLGDSRLSPVLGYLILNHLCPSLYSLLGDGLKSYQKDVIIGRRKLNPWSLVEVSTKTGPELVHLLFSKVSRLTQLRDAQRKFNAFIFGLLNMKQLDVWVLHLHQIYDQLSIFYLPSGFLPLAATSQLELRDELLLSLQPLSALTFHTDLLFEHHHLSLQDLPTPHQASSPGHMADNWAVPSLQNILDLGGWITHNLTWNSENKTPSLNKGKSLDSPDHKCSAEGSPSETSVFAGDTSAQLYDSTKPSSSHTVTRNLMTANTTESSPGPTPSKDLTTNWWGHLSQASRIYIPTNRESLTFTNLRKLTSWGPTDKELSQRATMSKEGDLAEQRFPEEKANGGASDTTSKGNKRQKQQTDTECNNLATAFTQGTSDGNSCSAGADRGKDLTTTHGSTGHNPNNEEKSNWLGQLFGASSSQSREMEAKNSKSRRPSSWLPPNVNVWNLIRKPITPLKQEEEPVQRENIRSQRSVRALCDHAALANAQLSFKKGEVLQLLGTVDEDWIQCRRGGDIGLVPVGYTSLIL